MDIREILQRISDTASGAYGWATKTVPSELSNASYEYMVRNGIPPEQARREAELLATRAGRTATMLESTPPGQALRLNEAVREDDPIGAGQAAVGLTAPVAGPLISKAIAAAPKTTATIGGILGAAITPAEAGPRLTRQQQRDLEFKRQAAEQGSQAEAARIKAESEARIAAENAQAASAAERERLAKAQAEADAAAERDRAARMPFRERYPDLAASLPFIGMGAAYAIPALAKAGKTALANRQVDQWEGAVGRAGETLDKMTSRKGVLNFGQKAKAAKIEAEMRAFADSNPAVDKPGAWNSIKRNTPTVIGALAPAEATLLPQEWDALNLPPGDPNKQAAIDLLTSPAELMKRAVPALMAGIPLAKSGSILPSWPAARVPPAAETQGLIEAFGRLANQGRK